MMDEVARTIQGDVRLAGQASARWALDYAQAYQGEPKQAIEQELPDDLVEVVDAVCDGLDAGGEGAFAPEAVEIYCRLLSDCLNLRAQWEVAKRALEKCVAAAEGLPLSSAKSSLLASLHGSLAWFYEVSGDMASAKRAVWAGRKYAKKAEKLTLQIQSLNRLAKNLRTEGKYQRALGAYGGAKKLCQRTGDERMLARVLNSTGLTQWHLGELEAALVSLSSALRLARKVGDCRREAQVLNNLGLVLLTAGAWQQARLFLTRGLACAEAVPDLREQGLIQGNLGEVRLALENWDESCFYQMRAAGIASGPESPSPYRLAKAKVRLAVLWRTRGGPEGLEKARSLAHEASELGDRNPEALHHFQILGRSQGALACLALGEEETAERLSREAVELLRLYPQFDGSPAEVMFHHFQVLEKRRPDEAWAALQDARRLLAEQAGRIRSPRLRQRFLMEVPCHRAILAATAPPPDP